MNEEFTCEDLFLLEAGSNSFEIHRRLLALGLRAVVLESGHVGKRAVFVYADNDKMAAARIVRVFLAGDAPCVWVPDAPSSERRELLHAHQKAVAGHTAAVNTLKSYLNQFGDPLLPWRNLRAERTRTWVRAQRVWSALQSELLTTYFEQLDTAYQRRQRLTRLIAQEISAEPLMLRCMKLLGIGMINAFALLAIIGDVRRFEAPEKLVAYIGLNPGQRQSGAGKNVKIGVGKRGRGDLRHLLIQGAQAVLKMGRHSALGQWGWKLFARKGHRHIAVAAVARKLVVQVWHLLSGNPPLALEANKTLRTQAPTRRHSRPEPARPTGAARQSAAMHPGTAKENPHPKPNLTNRFDGGYAPPNPAPLAAAGVRGGRPIRHRPWVLLFPDMKKA